MSTKTEIIYTYKSPIDIPPENIHGLQNGPTGKLSIGILDPQDYDYTYVSGLSGSYNNQFVPLGQDDTTAIISNIGGGTGNMLLQDEPSKLSIDSIKLDARVKQFQNLQIQNANLEVMYDYIPPLIISGATLNCQTQTQTLLTNAQLNLRFKKTIKNLPIILGMEFSFYFTKATAANSNGGWTNSIIVIHDDNGADYPAFRDTTIFPKNDGDSTSNTYYPFRSYQSFVGYRNNPTPDIATATCSIVRVKHPFGNPLKTGIAPNSVTENLNNYIMRTQNISNLRWFIYNGLIDKNLSTQPEGWVNAQTNGNSFNAVVSGNTKLFDHAAFYSTYAQSPVWGNNLPNSNGEGSGGRWIMTNVDNGNVSQSSFITTLFYTTYENFLNGSYTGFTRKNTSFTSSSNQSFNEILNIPNSVGVINLGSTQRVGINSGYVSEFQKLQTATNYNFGYKPTNPATLSSNWIEFFARRIIDDPNASNKYKELAIIPSDSYSVFQQARKLRGMFDSTNNLNMFESYGAEYSFLAAFTAYVQAQRFTDAWNDRTQNLCGGLIDFSSLNFVGSQGNFSIDSGITHGFNIQNTLQTFINNNNQELNITNINLINSGTTLGIYGNVVSNSGTKTLALIDGPSRSNNNIPLSTIINDFSNTFPATPLSNINVGVESNYNISYSFNNTIKGSTTIRYTNNVLQVGSNLNNGQVIVNTNAKIDIKPFIMNCISNAGSTGQLLTLKNWSKNGDFSVKLNDTINADLSAQLSGKKLYGDPLLYTIGVTGYYDFSGNTEGGGYTGKEYIGFNLNYLGSTSIYSIESNKLIGGETYNIDISTFLNSQIDPYSQEIHIDSFSITGGTGYKVYGIPQLGITGGQFDQNAVILWDSAIVKIQYNYDINPLGQYLEQSLLTEEEGSTSTLPINIIDTSDPPPYVQKSYTISKDITLPLNINDITFNIYSAVPGTPNIPRLDLGSTAIGKDFIDLNNASLTINYSYGDSLYSIPFKETFNIGYTLANFNPSAQKVLPTYLFTKQQRLLTFPSTRFSPLNTLYLVNIRKNQTGYTFNQTPFNWSVYDPLLFKNYQIINHEFNGIKKNSEIDKLISLNDYTIGRTGGTNIFESITDIERDPPIDINSRVELDNIAQILDNDTYITSIILDPVNSSSVPYLHRFFKFDYLNTDKELFLLVSSALTGSTAITANIDGLYVEINKTNPTPFITSQQNSDYTTTQQLITFDLSTGLTGSDQFQYGNTYLDPSLYGQGATSYLMDVKYKDQHSLEYFGFTSGSTKSTLIKGLLPNTTYKLNSLTYYPTLNEIYTLHPLSGLNPNGLSWINTVNYFVNNVVLNDTQRSDNNGNPINLVDNNYYICLNAHNSSQASPPLSIDGIYGSFWKILTSKSKMFNFEFQTGITGIEFSCKSDLTQISNKVLSYNLRISDLKYISYPDSIVHELNISDPYFSLCIDFNDPTVLVNDSPTKIILSTPLIYSESGNYIDVTIKALQRGKPYIGKIYLVNKNDSSYLSNRVYTSTIQIPKRSNLALSTYELSSYKYNNSLLNADVYSKNNENEISSMNSYNGYLYVMGSTGQIYSKQLIESNGNTYGSYNPITRTLPFEIRNLDPGTTFSNLTLRYDNTNTWLPPPLIGTTCTTTGLIGSTYSNNIILQNIPEFTTPAGPTLGLGITGIPNIKSPQFYNSKLDITNFNFYNNDPSNSYPKIYGGTATVRRFDNIVVGYKSLDSKSPYPLSVEIYLDKEKLNLGELNYLSISYEWTDFNNNIYSSFDRGIALTYATFIPQDQTSLKTYSYTPLFSKVIPSINMNVNKIGDMFLKDLKCDLILKAGLTGTDRGSPFFYKGEYDIGNTYYSNWTVSQGTTFYALLGTTMIKGISPLEDRAWVDLTPYLPGGYSFNTGINRSGDGKDVYLPSQGGYNNFTPFVYDVEGLYTIIPFNERYLKLSYNNQTYDGIFENLFPNQNYDLQYIRSQITLDNGNTIILHSGSTSMGKTQTLMDYIGSESLTGSTSTFFTLKELHYQGSTSYFIDGQIFLNGNTSIGKDIVSEGVTFGSTGTQDYLTYQPEISINQQVFNESSNSNIFYNTLSANVGITGQKFNKVVMNITGFGLTGYNLDDYFVVKGGTFGSTGSINYYKEFKLRDYYIDSQTFSNLVINNLEESTEYSNFKLYYKYAYMNRLSDTFVNIPTFLTRPGLDVSCTLVSGINNMYATISNITINDQQRTTLFESDDKSNQFIFYLYKFKPDTITGPPAYGPSDQTDYSIIKTTRDIPFDVKLPGADQGVVYDRMYFHHTEFIEGATSSFKKSININ
jgi:hypothetical protein